MKKRLKKLTIHRETLCSLDNLRTVAGEAAWVKTVDATYCVSNCPPCYFTPATNCC